MKVGTLETGIGYPRCFAQRVRKTLRREEMQNWRAQKSAQVIEKKEQRQKMEN